VRLDIVSTKKGGARGSKGIVQFKAFYLQEGEEYVVNEISRFCKLRGRSGTTSTAPSNRSPKPASMPIKGSMHSVAAGVGKRTSVAAEKNEGSPWIVAIDAFCGQSGSASFFSNAG